MLTLFLYQFRIYAKTTFLYQIRIYAKSTCVHALIAMEIFHYTRGWKSPIIMVSGMDAMFSYIFNLCDVRMRIAMTCIVPRGYLRGPPKKSVSEGSFIRGKSVMNESALASQRVNKLLYYIVFKVSSADIYPTWCEDWQRCFYDGHKYSSQLNNITQFLRLHFLDVLQLVGFPSATMHWKHIGK